LKVEGKALGKWKVVWERSKEEYERVMKEWIRAKYFECTYENVTMKPIILYN
jgi:hypothetical protein